MRRLLRRLRHWPDRLVHERRRAEAIRAIRAAAPTRVVMGCLGNICRSPYAAERLRAAGLDLKVESAGFIGPGRSPPEEAVQMAAERGVDVSGHRSRQFTLADLSPETLILVMEPGHVDRLAAQIGPAPGPVLLLGDLDPEPIETRIIIDPFGHSRATFAATFARIDRCVATLIESLRRGTDPAG